MTVIRIPPHDLTIPTPIICKDGQTASIVKMGPRSEVEIVETTQFQLVATRDDDVVLSSSMEVDDRIMETQAASLQKPPIEINPLRSRTSSLDKLDDPSLQIQTLRSSREDLTSYKDLDAVSREDLMSTTLPDRAIIPAIPPSVMRQSTFDYGTIVTSRSKMAGLKTKQSSKLKRLYPDASLFIKRILKYHPPEVVLKESGTVSFYGAASHTQLSSDLEELPTSFESATEMRKLFSPILLAEGISALKQEFLNNSDTSGFWSRSALSFQLVVGFLDFFL